MAKRFRSQIPPEIAAKILFDSDRTCCICRIRGKAVQIHHLDENPSNHDPSNLAVLCFDCHRDTQIRGGFDRKLDAHQVRLYKSDWISKVQNRRTITSGPDRTIQSSSRTHVANDNDASLGKLTPSGSESPVTLTLTLIRELPQRRTNAYRRAQPKWDTGVTAEMVDGNGIVIEELKRILIDLAQLYPSGHFDGRRPDDYFRDKVTDLGRWHGCLNTGGTIASVMTGGAVIASLEKMVEDMVSALTSFRDDFNFHAWQQNWREGT